MAENVQKQGRPPAFTYESGLTGLRVTGGRVQEEFLTSLRGSRGVAVFQEMSLNDPVVGGMLHAISQTIRKLSWSVETTDDSQESQKARNLVATSFNDMSFTWSDTLSDSFHVSVWVEFF